MSLLYILTVEHPTGSWGVMAVADSWENANNALHSKDGREPFGLGKVSWKLDQDIREGVRLWVGQSGSRRFGIWERELISE